MNLTLKVWRQKNASDAGRFETYEARDISEHMSFLEMLDVVNEDLIRKGQDRDAREVDLLLARQREQHVDRPLEPVEIEHERRFAGAAPRGLRGKRDNLGRGGERHLSHEPCPVIVSTRSVNKSAG